MSDDSQYYRELAELINNAKHKVQEQGGPRPPYIFPMLGGNDDKAYKATEIPIGLNHHLHGTNDEYFLHEEKLKCLNDILSRRGEAHGKELLNHCFRWLTEPTVQADIKEYYSEKIDLALHDFAKILLLDACFIVKELLEHRTKYALVNKVKWCDLLKLENQIPFFVIQDLYHLLKMPDDPNEINIPIINIFFQVDPLLDFPRIKLDEKEKHKSHAIKIFPTSEREGTINMSYHLLHLFHSFLVHGVQSPSTTGQHNVVLGGIPSAIELERAWIKISENEDATSFMDVTYKNGKIKLPKLHIHNLTYSFLRDLIEFERLCKVGLPPQEKLITLFIVFMRCILKTPQDVKLLVSKGILVHELTTDEAVVEIFYSLCQNKQYRIQGSYLENLFYDLNKDYEAQWRNSLASLRRTYFPNRWEFCSTLAAGLLLIFTFLQVVFAIYPYLRPRH